jgi:hypothetical protein
MSNEITTYDKFKAQLAEFKAADAERSFDVGTSEGYADCKTYHGQLREVRNRTDDLRLDTTKDLRAKVKAINNEGNEIIAEVDAMAAPYKTQLDAEDDKEQKVIDDLAAANLLVQQKDEDERLAYIDNQAFDNAKLAKDLKDQKDTLDKEKADLEAEKIAAAATAAAVKATEAKAVKDAEEKAKQAVKDQAAAVEETKHKAKVAADALAKKIADKYAKEQEEKEAAAEVERKRKNDFDHQNEVDRAVWDKILDYVGYVDEEAVATSILNAIKNNEIPNVTINY